MTKRYYHRDLRRLADNLSCDFCQRNKLDGPWINQVHERPYQLKSRFQVKNPSQDSKSRTQAKVPNPNQKHKLYLLFVCLLACLLVCLTNSAWRMTPCHDTEFTEAEPPQDIANAKEYIDEALSIAMHAMRAGIHSTLGSSPGSLTFNRDMLLNIPLIAEWHAITQRREHPINENLIRKNKNDVTPTMSLNKGYLRINGKPAYWVREPVDHTGFCRLMLMVH
jgi:hypothetical protein